MSKYVDRILGSYPSIEPTEQVKCCKMIYTYCYPGVIDHFEGLEEVLKQNIIEDYFLYKTKGMEILHSETSGDRPLGYLVVADNEAELNKKIRITDDTIKVIDESGNDILIHNLL